MRQGETAGVVLESMGGVPRRIQASELVRLFDDTTQFWRDWAGDVDRARQPGRMHRQHRLGRRPGPLGLTGIVPYEATKGAAVSFTRGLSNEVASEGIRVNSVSPGLIDTEMASSPELRDLGTHSQLGRLGRSEEIAAAVSWLVSPEASYVTGSDITVSGGL